MIRIARSREAYLFATPIIAETDYSRIVASVRSAIRNRLEDEKTFRTKIVSVKIDYEIYRRINEDARRRRITISEFMREIVKKYVEECGGETSSSSA